MNLTPKKLEEISSATITQTLGLILTCSALCALTAYAADPSWWSSPGTGSQAAVLAPQVVTNNGVVTTNYIPNDYAVATQGQLKQFAARAVDELNANLSGGAGTNLNTMMSNWAVDYVTNGYNSTHIKPSDYTAINVGQLKYIGNKIWARLVAGGYTNAVPSWLAQNTNSDNALANLGQLKEVFNFSLTSNGDSDGNGLPDAWEIQYFGHIGNDPNSSPDGNGLTLLQDYQQGNDPTNYYSQGGTTITPVLTLVSGDRQEGAAGTLASQPLIFSVTKSDGTVLANAPVNFTVTGGGLSATPVTSAVTTLTVSSNANGQAQVYFTEPSAPSVHNIIAVKTGTVQLTASSDTNDSSSTDPSNCQSVYNADGSVDMTWANNNNDPIPISIQNADGSWKLIATVPAGTTSYHIPPQ
jgi:hypothetical protein